MRVSETHSAVYALSTFACTFDTLTNTPPTHSHRLHAFPIFLNVEKREIIFCSGEWSKI